MKAVILGVIELLLFFSKTDEKLSYSIKEMPMKKKIVVMLPFIIVPIFIPIYIILDNLILVDIFGCGCVPSAQTNMLNLPYNANDLRLTVFSVLAIGMSVWSFIISKTFNRKFTKLLYCFVVIVFNVMLALWVVKSFVWA